MKPIIPFLLVLCSVMTAAQDKRMNPSTRCTKDMQIDEFLLPDDAAAAKAAFEELRVALRSGDRSRVIALVAFPADLVLSGRGATFDTPQELEKRYGKIFTAYVKNSVREQDSQKLIAGWEGVSLSNGAVRFRRTQAGDFRIDNVQPRPVALAADVKEFLDKRLTCPPVVVEGHVAAFDWFSDAMPGGFGIYIDHFIVDVAKVLRGTLPEGRIRVDFWGESHRSKYNQYSLPADAFRSGPLWRMYLRPADEPPDNPEVCSNDVQETIPVDENGREVEKRSAITVLTGETSLTFSSLRCFEADRQFFDSLVP